MRQKIKADQYDTILLKNGKLLDPSGNIDKKTDLLINQGKIEDIADIDSSTFKGDIVDCTECVITPGFIDMHVHLREPGQEEKETIESGCRAAMAGGFTGVCAMPNTKPPVDSRSQVEYILDRASTQLVDVYPVASVTMGQKGELLTEMADLAEAGAVAFSDDGHPVADAMLFRHALEYAHMVGRPIIEHAEESSLSADGVMHEGRFSTLSGMEGIPSIAETIAVSRDIIISEYTNIPVHIAHVSTGGAVRLIRDAKSRGIQVTAETCPHYLVLTDEDVQSFDTNLKMNPPLRSKKDQAELIKGLQDGTIDAIATDHAPHTIDDKEVEFNFAAFGITGLETAIGMVLTHFFHNQRLSMAQIVNKMAIQPRKILDLSLNSIQTGNDANLTLLKPNLEWEVDINQFQSLSKNSPFHGWKLKGKAVGVINKGKCYLDESLSENRDRRS